jgi:polysaccharide export outer membrane protein
MSRCLNLLTQSPRLLVIGCLAVLVHICMAQNQPAASGQDAPKKSPETVSTPASDSSKQQEPPKQQQEKDRQADTSALVIGPGDDLEVAVYGAPDLSVHTRVTSDGNVSLPLAGYVRVEGLTSSEAEAAIEAQLRQGNILNDPHVSVFVKEYSSSNVSVAGEVVRPGSYSTLGPHRLFDVLQAAGGLNEKAANRAVLTHRGSDDSKTFELSKDPAQMAQSNVEVRPGDTIIVPAAPIVYILGEVGKPGGYVLGSGINGVTLLRVVAAAGGPSRDASLGKTKMLRKTPDGLKQVPLPLKKILNAKAPDVPLEADDIIFVPNSRFKELINAGALATSLGTVALYRLP